MSLIGYARVSTEEQATAQQRAALVAAGVPDDRIFTDDGVSGYFVAAADRPGFRRVLETAVAGDTLVVWRLDRLGRSVVDVILTVADLGRRGIEFKSLSESIDTNTAAGKAMFHMTTAFAQLYRDQISENTKLAMAAIKAGTRPQRPGAKPIGRPKSLSAEQERAVRLMRATGASVTAIARRVGASRSAVWRALDTRTAPGVNYANGERETLESGDSRAGDAGAESRCGGSKAGSGSD